MKPAYGQPIDQKSYDATLRFFDVLRHRIGLSYEAEASEITSEEIVSRIINSLRHLGMLPDETQVLPGHGEATSIGEELAHNPYMDR